MTLAANHPTLSTKPARWFWGWGYLRDGLTARELDGVHAVLAGLGPTGPALPEPQVADYALSAPRGQVLDSLSTPVSLSPYDRITHCHGKGFGDVARMWMRHVPSVPYWVAFPRKAADIADVLDWASRHDVAVMPFGGGTSVVGGVEADVGSAYAATLSLDLGRPYQVLEIDTTSRAALIQAGILGPDLEAKLRSHGVTLRHFPQSFEFSTLGGWIATRAGGHYATQATHIDDFVESSRMVTPAGVVETRRLPVSGAGPAPNRLIIGSEGTMGVTTQAWMRLQNRPVFRASASVVFDDMRKAAACVRALSQAGLQPTICRLLDAREVALAGVGDRRSPTLVLGFESADHPLQAWMDRALELVADHAGRWGKEAVAQSMRPACDEPSAHRSGAAGDWRNAFIRMPYWRDETTRLGAIFDTFESAVTWNRFETFYDGVRHNVQAAIERITGHASAVSCRFMHVYPDGPVPYFTFMARGSSSGDIASAPARHQARLQQRAGAARRHQQAPPRGGPRTPQRLRDRSACPDARCPFRRHGRAGPARRDEPRRAVRPGREGGGPSRCAASGGACALSTALSATIQLETHKEMLLLGKAGPGRHRAVLRMCRAGARLSEQDADLRHALSRRRPGRRVRAPDGAGLRKAQGQVVVVDNVGGVGGALGIEKMPEAAADGYQFLMGTPSDVILTPLAMAAVKHSDVAQHLNAAVHETLRGPEYRRQVESTGASVGAALDLAQADSYLLDQTVRFRLMAQSVKLEPQ